MDTRIRPREARLKENTDGNPNGYCLGLFVQLSVFVGQSSRELLLGDECSCGLTMGGASITIAFRTISGDL